MFWLAFLAKPAVAGLIKWGIGALITYSLAKPAIEKWGGTPNNRASAVGITPEEAYDYSQKNKKDKLAHVKEKAEERNKELKEDNEKLKDDIKKLEKRVLQETQDWKDETNSAEKARKLLTVQATQKDLDGARSQITKNNKEMKENEQAVTKVFDELSVGAEKLNQEQLRVKNNRPDLGSWFNWGVIAVGVIVAVLVVKFIFGAFKKFTREVG